MSQRSTLLVQSKKTAVRFGVSVTQREPKNHSNDCYFSFCLIHRYNRKKNQKLISYPDNIPSAICLISHGPNIQVPFPPTELQKISRLYAVKLTEGIFVDSDIR
ncbi:hypothetical protein TNCV_3519301 [Trichonephila clavipes]|uniref:Uncharacterized protein n=1 Tax=Trichonephila clavipes TaxID=2585209 RepID=A0A8X6STQ7_TRICX|nr:hypothetical protein TNCV_3519301 [Trichonephila clavipes]